MQKLLCGLAFLIFLASTAMGAPPAQLSNDQLDAVTAGAGNGFTFAPAIVTGTGLVSGGVFLFSLGTTDVSNTSTVMLNIDPVECPTCYLNIRNESFTIQVLFGPSAVTH